jgi:hypothetical protein
MKEGVPAVCDHQILQGIADPKRDPFDHRCQDGRPAISLGLQGGKRDLVFIAIGKLHVGLAWDIRVIHFCKKISQFSQPSAKTISDVR